MDVPTGLPSDDATTRTFLIADIRGYTTFTVEHGDEKAAELASRFATIVRDVVVAHDGNLLELRGDEALVVFVSARRALRAAVELQARFVSEELPRGVGIGLDSGEAIPIEGGFRGTALNLAARLCAEAGPGETIASEGVIHLAARVEGIEYVGARTLRLKGFDQPVRAVDVISTNDALKRPRRSGLHSGRRRLPERSLIVAGVVGLLAIIVAVVGLSGAFGGRSNPAFSPLANASASGAGPTPPAGGAPPAISSNATQVPAAGGPNATLISMNGGDPPITVPPGRYTFEHFRPGVVFHVVGGDWVTTFEAPDGFELRREVAGAPDGFVMGGFIQVVIDGPCRDAKATILPPGARSFIDWLQGNPWLATTNANPVNFGEWTGLQVDVETAKSPAPGVCSYPDMKVSLSPHEYDALTSSVFVFRIADDSMWISPTDRLRITVIDVPGRPVTIVQGVIDKGRFDGFNRVADQIVGSMRFDSP